MDRSKSNGSQNIMQGHTSAHAPYDDDVDHKSGSRRSSSYVSSHFSYALVGSQQHELGISAGQLKAYPPHQEDKHITRKEFDYSDSAKSLPSDISVDLQQHVGPQQRDKSDDSDYDDDKERRQLAAQ